MGRWGELQVSVTSAKEKEKKKKERNRTKCIFSMVKAGSVEYPFLCLGISVALSVPVLRYATVLDFRGYCVFSLTNAE